jgi:hypothetical protein
MCEEIANEYDVKSEDLYAVLSGEDIINEGEPVVEEINPVEAAIQIANDMAGDYDGAYDAILQAHGEDVLMNDAVQNALYKANVEEDVNRIRHLAGVEPVIEDDPDYSDADRIESLDEYGQNSYEATHAMEVIDIMKDQYGDESLRDNDEYTGLRDSAIKIFLDERKIKYDDEEFEVSSTIDNFRTDVDTYQPEESSESVNRIKHLAGV